MKLYIPTSNLNINTLFSSECISPKSFYDIRNYGLKRFHSNEMHPNDDFIYLYDSPFFFNGLDKDLDEECINIEIDTETSLIDNNYLSKLDISEVNVFAYPKTIYFDLSVKFVFTTDNNVKKNIAHTIGFDLVKTIDKYSSNFISSAFSGNESFIKLLYNLPKIENQHKSIFIIVDEKINFLKGAYYSSILGDIQSGSPEFNNISNSFRLICNQIGNLKTELELNSFKNQQGKQNKGLINPKLNNLIETIKDDIRNTRQQFENYIGKEKLIDVFKSQLNFTSDEFEELFSILNHELIRQLENQLSAKDAKFSLIDLIYNKIQDVNPTFPFLVNRLIYFVDALVKNYLNGWSNEYNDNQINSLIHLINLTLEKTFSKNKSKSDLIKKRFEFSEGKFKCLHVSKEYSIQYEIVFNALISNHSNTDTKINDEAKCDLIKYVGERFKDFPNEIEYLRKLYKYFERKLDTPFNPYETNNPVLSGFAYFLFSIGNINQLYSTLSKNSFKEPFIPLSFWGAYQGYSSMSRELTNKLKDIDTDLLNSLVYSIDNPFDLVQREEANTQPNIVNEPETDYANLSSKDATPSFSSDFLEDTLNNKINDIILDYINRQVNFKEIPNEQMVYMEISQLIKSTVKIKSRQISKENLSKIQSLLPLTKIVDFIEHKINAS